MHSSHGEKSNIRHRENAPAEAPAVYNEQVDTSAIDEKALVRKLDLRLIPWLSFLYLLSFLDRTSIGNARVSVLGNLCTTSLLIEMVAVIWSRR